MTQVETILSHLKTHGSVTKAELWNKHWIMCSSARIDELRKMVGRDKIETVMVPNAGKGRHALYIWKENGLALSL